jgi:hypothetical protein
MQTRGTNPYNLRLEIMCIKRFTNEGREGVWSEMEAITLLHVFPILEKCRIMAYKLELTPSLAGVHNIFHVSQLKKCLKGPIDVVLAEVAPLEVGLTYPEHPIKILD